MGRRGILPSKFLQIVRDARDVSTGCIQLWMSSTRTRVLRVPRAYMVGLDSLSAGALARWAGRGLLLSFLAAHLLPCKCPYSLELPPKSADIHLYDPFYRHHDPLGVRPFASAL